MIDALHPDKLCSTGRPSQLLPSLEKASEYLDGGFIAHGEAVPSIKGLAHYIGKSRSCLYAYAAKSQAFKDTLERVKTRQEAMLINGGLDGSFNAHIVKLMLANHGYRAQ